MRRRLKLSKYRQNLVVSHVDLVRMLARYFVQNRQHWQRGVLIDDLEGEGFLALSKAARTYDKKRLPYPRAYFARAILNGMLKWIKRTTRQPGITKVSLQEAADLVPEFDQVDHLRLAIEQLPEEDRELATDRFVRGQTLRAIAAGHQIPLRIASLRSARLAKVVSESLDIRLSPREPAATRHADRSSPSRSSGSKACGHPPSRGRG